MFEVLTSEAPSTDIVVMSAAVADVRPKTVAEHKVKKSHLHAIELQENPDILATLGASKREKQIFVAFAAESGVDHDEARRKLRSKNADLIYLNDISGGSIFGSDQTEGWILDNNSLELHISATSKDTLARILLDQALIKLGYANV